ncbi:lytic polysaccharide monooxygenase [Lophiostoma macrostomum CBS 122681]|uniref:lytic cellulose monooxygenase (C4-dehydrogenating) n=1 Tax=Lophiostoma macrostomum CBS 122681 TaxID=1314788 RepID=A0A6A6SK71_9PLEO|nr:lytic polysaccharide monooxygenase [Lophiostoma macrostomum CBS 122681]
MLLQDQFPIFIVNGTRSEWWRYIRPTGLDSYGYQFDPVREYFTEPQVCGRNATRSGHGVDTAIVIAGSSIGFQVVGGTTQSIPGIEPPRVPNPAENDNLYHPGPGQLYLSKAPLALEDYEGDGEWFKVGLIGSSDGINWDAYLKSELNFTIPATTPPGKYLARVEHLYIQREYNQTQQYINCAHIEVVGPGGGTPGPMVKFPGAYALDEPGVWLPPDMSEDEMKAFKGAGPSIWRG